MGRACGSSERGASILLVGVAGFMGAVTGRALKDVSCWVGLGKPLQVWPGCQEGAGWVGTQGREATQRVGDQIMRSLDNT